MKNIKNNRINDTNCVIIIDKQFFRAMYVNTELERILLWQIWKNLLAYLLRYKI